METFNNPTIRVLWVEDDKDFIRGFVGTYEDRLDFILANNWEEARHILNKEYDDLHAIILDARCKQFPTSLDNARKFLAEALSDLRDMERDRGRLIPWYVLSGGDKEEISDSILDYRLNWDARWPNTYYMKNTSDEKALVDNIINYIESNTPARLKVKTDLFKDVFNAISSAGLEKRIEEYLMSLLLPFLEPMRNEDYNNRFTNARILVEAIFWDMYNRQLLNEAVLTSDGKTLNLSVTSLALLGDKDKFPQWFLKKGKILDKSNCKLYGALPKILADNLKNIIQSAGSNEHHEPIQLKEEEKRAADIRDYRATLGNTPYLLKSFALQLCDFVLWYCNYLKNEVKTDLKG